MQPIQLLSSPRAWGWSAYIGFGAVAVFLFPTGVGMVRSTGFRREPKGALPHGRGDGPVEYRYIFELGASSPRAWGWSEFTYALTYILILFPTGVGMVRTYTTNKEMAFTLPHGRGDGPRHKIIVLALGHSSPRAWGWSADPVELIDDMQLFPTGVGMVRDLARVLRAEWTLPHGRGDGPQ